MHLLLPATCLALATALPAVAAVQTGTVDNGVRYAMGGVGLGEREELRTMFGDYNLWVSTAARNGNYLADVDVRVVDERSGDVMLQGAVNGPWLLAELPPGRYIVQATSPDGVALSRHVQVGRNGLQRALLSFRQRPGGDE